MSVHHVSHCTAPVRPGNQPACLQVKVSDSREGRGGMPVHPVEVSGTFSPRPRCLWYARGRRFCLRRVTFVLILGNGVEGGCS